MYIGNKSYARLIAFGFCGVVQIASGVCATGDRSGASATIEAFYGAALNVIKSDEPIDIAVVVPPAEYADNVFNGCAEIRSWVHIPPKEGISLRHSLLDERNYEWRLARACDPKYDICLRFGKDHDKLYMLYDSRCRLLLISRNGKPLGAAVGPAIDREIARVARIAESVSGTQTNQVNSPTKSERVTPLHVVENSDADCRDGDSDFRFGPRG